MHTAGAQVTDKIKHQADQADQQQNSGGGGSSSSGGSDPESSSGCLSDLFSGCFTGCITNLVADAIPAMIDAQRNSLSKRDSVPRIVSVEIRFDYGTHPGFIHDENPYNYMIPRIRLNWGIFSTDFRMHQLFEKDSLNQYYRTWDWQVLDFNLLNCRHARLSLGGGFSKEEYTGHVNPEIALNNDIYWGRNLRWKTTLEGRIAEDLIRDTWPRVEGSAGVGYALAEGTGVHLYLQAGFLDDWYYSRVNTWGIYGGLNLRFD